MDIWLPYLGFPVGAMSLFGMHIVKYSINTYVRYLSYALLIIAELPNDELTGNHTLSLPSLCL